MLTVAPRVAPKQKTTVVFWMLVDYFPIVNRELVGGVLGSMSCLMQSRGFFPPLRRTASLALW